MKRIGLGMLLLLATLVGCNQAEPAMEPAVAPAGNPWIVQAQAAHAMADSADSEESVLAAEQALTSFVESDVPESIHADDRSRLTLDAYYRLSSLALQREDAEAALSYSEAGLAYSAETSNGSAAQGSAAQGNVDGPDRVFVANLLVMKGQALERLSRDVEATEPYFEALEINRDLLRDTLEGTP